MKLKTLIQTKRHKIIEIASKHGASNVRVFGSVARGEETLNLPDLKERGFPYRLLTRLSPPPERHDWAVYFTSTGAPTAEGFKYFMRFTALSIIAYCVYAIGLKAEVLNPSIKR